MQNVYIFSLIGIVLIGVLILNWFFNKKTRVKRKLKKYPVIPLSVFKDDEYGRIVGKIVLAGEPLEAPLSKRKCAYYYVHVQQQVSSGKSTHWKTVIEEEKAGNFVVQEGNHCALIDTSKIKSYIVQDKKYKSGAFHDAEENLEQYLNNHNNKSTGFLGFNKKLRYMEGILEPGEMVAVIGKGKWKATDRMDIPAPYGKILVIMQDENKPVYMSDDPDTIKN